MRFLLGLTFVWFRLFLLETILKVFWENCAKIARKKKFVTYCTSLASKFFFSSREKITWDTLVTRFSIFSSSHAAWIMSSSRISLPNRNILLKRFAFSKGTIKSFLNSKKGLKISWHYPLRHNREICWPVQPHWCFNRKRI